MYAQDKDNGYGLECKVTPTENGFRLEGNFHALVHVNNTDNELDQIETQIEQIGQQLKRDLCRQTLETADERNIQILQKTQSQLIKNGKPPFTIVTKFGEVKLKRQQLRNTQTGTTMIPSAILWQTSQHRHITRQVTEAVCVASQSVSYRKATRQLANEAGVEQLISTTTVWNKKQEKGQALAQRQQDFVEQVLSQKEVTPPCGVPSQGTRRIEEATIQIQLDEVKTKSQEPGKKMNLTYTATLETSKRECFYLAASTSEQLIQQVWAYLTVLGLLAGKRLEVLSDGARWIGDWVGSLSGVAVEHILCWYHLRKRIYESFGAFGFPKEKRKLLQHEILGHLWRGRTAQAVWILWGLRSSARVPDRITDLIGYLLRKRRVIVDYEVRRQSGLWKASTRVEKWNDLSITERCKHRGTSWTSSGVLAVALYAAEQKQTAQRPTPQTAQINFPTHTTN